MISSWNFRRLAPTALLSAFGFLLLASAALADGPKLDAESYLIP
jgi:hypothetical protein